MKRYLFTILTISGFLLGCGVRATLNESDLQKPQQTPQEDWADGSQPGSSLPAGTPYSYDTSIFEADGQVTKFTYVEVLERTDPNQVTMIFYTRTPGEMCNVSTLTDASSYQPNFKFLKLTINQSSAGEQDISLATFGTRGKDFPDEYRVKGKLNLVSRLGNHYQGWINLSGAGFELRGNFNVGGCAKTESHLDRLKINRIKNQTINLIDTKSGKSSAAYLNFTYSLIDNGNFEGYRNKKGELGVFLTSLAGSYEKFELKFYGLTAGDYLNLANYRGDKQSPGSGVAYFEGNALIMNDLTKPHMTNDTTLAKAPKVKVEYIAVSDLHKVTVFLFARELTAEFKAQ